MTVALVDKSGGQSIGGSTGIKTFSFTVTAGADYILVSLACDDRNTPPTLVKYDGVLLTKLVDGFNIVPGERYAAIWGGVAADIVIASGDNEVSITVNSTQQAHAYAWAGTTTGQAEVVDTATSLANSGNARVTLDGGSDNGMAFIATCDQCQSLRSDTTEDYGIWSGSFCHKFAHETTATTGSRTRGWDGNNAHATVGVMVADTQIILTPDPVGMVLGVTASPTVTVSADQNFIQGNRPGIVMGLNPPLVTVSGPRQVSLVGGDPETPEMTEGGIEGQTLTFHGGHKPTWEDNDAGAKGDKVFRYQTFK